jgi:apolipoprotein N-acyltransferase
MSGFVVLAAIVIIWPLTAWLVLAASTRPAEDRWRPFALAAGAALTAALVLVVAASATSRANGTTEAMTALGAGVLAVACLAGALISVVCALVLRGHENR